MNKVTPAQTQKAYKTYEQFVMAMMAPDSKDTLEHALMTGGLGCAGEGGEVADIAKKVIFHHIPFDERMKDKLLQELGDQLFYITFLAMHPLVLDSNIGHVMAVNVKKLRERYKTGTFTVAEAMVKEGRTPVAPLLPGAGSIQEQPLTDEDFDIIVDENSSVGR